jgi:hypothetical protein
MGAVSRRAKFLVNIYLEIVETDLGSPRLRWDLICVCNLYMGLLDSSVGAFAITSLRVHLPFSEINWSFFSTCTCYYMRCILVNAFHCASLLYYQYASSLQ